jgi:hypothetical protein
MLIHYLSGGASEWRLASEFQKKAKFARSSESLPTGLFCNQYNPEMRRQIRRTDSAAKFRGYLKQKTVETRHR